MPSKFPSVARTLLTLLAALGTLLAVPSSGAAQPAAPPSAEAMRELAERMMGPQPLGPGAQPITARLLVAVVPEGLPIEVVAQPGSRVLGSLARYAGDSLVGATVLIEAPGPPAEILAFYDERLAALGWTSTAFLPSGLQPTLVSITQMYCQGSDPGSPTLNLTLVPRPGGRHDVRFAVDTLFAGSCGGFPRFPPGVIRLLPPLYPPSGVELMPSNPAQLLGGGKPALQSSQGIAVTSMDVAEVERSFGEQLAGVGWARTESGVAGPAAWSTWTIPVEGEWQGLLFVLDGPGADQRTIHVQVATAAAPAGLSPFPR